MSRVQRALRGWVSDAENSGVWDSGGRGPWGKVLDQELVSRTVAFGNNQHLGILADM